MKHVDTLMRQALSESVFPGGVLLVSRQGSILFYSAYGDANIFTGAPMTRETIFDLASLTKPLATTLAVMKLVQQDKIDLEQELGHVLPEFKNSAKSAIRIKHLLYHTSGLPDYRPFYKILSDRPQEIRQNLLRKLLVAESLIHPIGKAVLYSDLGFMILRWVIEKVAGARLDHFVAAEIYGLLDLENLFFIELDSPLPSGRFAATERCPWRRTVLEGRVHDENAYAVGGIEGHAGLFGTAVDVHRLLCDLLANYHGDGSSRLFPKKFVRPFFKRLPDSDKALGFDTPSCRNSSSGSFFSKNSVGHLGFTGTSFWMDLEHSVIVVLFTNRIHPSRENNAIKAFRPKLHDAVMETLTMDY
jgi:CubicO group peptidase (beta-lactamase class C family)